MWVLGQKFDGGRAAVNTDSISALVYDEKNDMTIALVAGCGKYPIAEGDCVLEVAHYDDESNREYLNLAEFDFSYKKRNAVHRYRKTDGETLTWKKL